MRIAARALESLEWPPVVEELRGLTRTPEGAARCDPGPDSPLFAPDLRRAQEQLEETREARLILGRGASPISTLPEVRTALARSARGGTLDADELLDIARVAEGLAEARRQLAFTGEETPILAGKGELLPDMGDLARELRAAFDAEGGLRDSVSPLLAESRAAIHRLGGELQRRMNASLHDREIATHLSDTFVTMRGGRYVLPVRADARSRVPGIVHDASSSGTTIFVEPERVVPLNNQLREAELSVQRETRRILRALSESVGAVASSLRAALAILGDLDLAFARAALAERWRATGPAMRDAGVLILPALRHPLLPAHEVVANDLRLGDTYTTLVLSGPNAGGKSVAMKALALAVIGAHAGLHCACDGGARIDWTETVLADIGDAQSLRESLSTFSAHLANLAEICREADAHSFVALDEVGDGTDPGEGAALAQAVLETLAERGARVVVTTHYNLLKEMADLDPRFENASFEFDNESLAPTFRLRMGSAGTSSATAVAARMGLPQYVLDRANELLDREDRQLEQTLAALNESRVAIERERREAERLRVETEVDRAAVRERLEQLQARRDKVHDALREELETAFQSAHDQVGAVIRSLQRGEGDGRAATRAREQLEALRRKTEADETTGPRPARHRVPDWRRAQAGDPVRVAGGQHGTLEALPDRRGRVAVRVGSARLVIPADQVATPDDSPPDTARRDAPRPERRAASPTPSPALREIDLRGSRVAGALDRLEAALDQSMLADSVSLRVIHGVGSGALRRAVREALRESPYVESFAAAAANEGGEGATEIVLKH